MYNSKTCNFCPHLKKTCREGNPQLYDVACGIVTYEAFGVSRPRRIDCGINFNDEIASPYWCPNTKSATESKQEQKEEPVYTSIADRREKMKSLKRNLKWEDIQEGEIYIIPKILNQPRKIVRVVGKTDLSCRCHEINEYSGNEYSYCINVYPTDLDAIFLNKIRNF